MDRMKQVAVALVLVAVVFSSRPVWAGGFMEERPWLAERSTWSETTGPAGDVRGWWAVGNSRVFGFVGPGLSNAMIHQITGPHIMLAGVMNNGSAFGPAAMMLSVGGKSVGFTKQTLSRVRGTNIVVMELEGPQVKMTVFDYAPLGLNALLRTVIVQNVSQADLPDVVLAATVSRTILKDGRLYDKFQGGTGASAMGQTRQLFSAFLEPCEARGSADTPGPGSLIMPLGALAAGAEAVRTQYLVFSMAEVGDEAATLEQVKQGGVGLLKKAYDDWRAWLAGTTRLECPDERLVDLVDDTKTLVKIQTAEPQYAAGPMEFFAGVWVRDSNGPFRYYLRMGRLEAARGMLEFYYRASALNKHISNWVPMDIDVGQPLPADLDWAKVPSDPVETPSWLILQHRLYYEYTGDLEPIRAHWEYLKRCLMGQLVNEQGEPFHMIEYVLREPGPNTLYRFQHHGDETWIYPGFEVLNSAVFPEPCDHPHWDAYSADSTWEFVVSAEALADFAQRLGKADEAKEMETIARDARAALERDYWMAERGLYGPALNMRALDVHQPPFAMVNFNPLWIGYLKGDDPKAISNVLETMKYTMNPNFVTDVTETLRVYVGMQPGMFLYNLAAIRHPFAEPALKALVNVASPSGEYTEKQVTDPKSYDTSFHGHRIRPWEGGVNLDAAFYYLTGLEPNLGNGRIALCPRMPAEWKRMAVTSQRLGDGQLDLEVTDDGAKRTYTMKWTGTKPLQADFTVCLPQAKIGAVTVNGASASVTPQNRWGLTTARLEVALPAGGTAGGTAVVAVEYTKEAAEPVEFQRQRYQYIVPKDVPPHDLVLWDAEPRKGNLQDLRIFDYLRGKVNFRLIMSFNPASPAWLRPFLLKSDGTLNTPLFLMGTDSVTASLKYEKWWGGAELTRLFTEYMKAGGVIVAMNTGETNSDYFGGLLGDSSYFVVPGQPTAIVPEGDDGKAACDLLGLFVGEDKPTASRMFQYKEMVVLARPETEASAATILAKKFGKGFFMTMLINRNFEQAATLAEALARPATREGLGRIISSAKPQTVAGAFKDYSKNGGYADDFTGYEKGSTGLPVWLPVSGIWKMEDGQYHELAANGYDFTATINATIKGDYRVEAKVRLVEGILEGGVLFNMASRFSLGSSQMVRFCGHEALWCGPFGAGGGFTLERSVPTGISTRDNSWVTLTVTVHNSRGTYDVAINGKAVAEGLPLTHIPRGGEGRYVGLVSCRGHVAYDSVKITPLKP